MKTIIKLTLSACLLILLQQIIMSQQIFPGSSSRQHTPNEESLMSQMHDAKISGDKNRLQSLQTGLDNETGSVTKPAENYPGTFVMVNEHVNNDNINIVELSQLNGIQALATVTEQRGQNAGRIWVAAVVSNTSARDSIYYFYSDDGGTSWTLIAYLYLANSDQVNFDQMDMEIIEDNTGSKYIWTVYGLTTAAGREFCGVNVIRTPVFQGTSFSMLWPGENLSNTDFSRRRPRITSDNARYDNAASVYISTTIDSASGQHHFGICEFAKCMNPYTTSPSITYFPRWSGLILSYNNPTDDHFDIAFMNNGGDSLLLVVSNLHADPTVLESVNLNIGFEYNTSNITNFTSNNFNKQFARVACSGGSNQKTAMIVYRENYQNSGDWDIKAQKTTNGGLTWNEINVDTRRDNVIIPYPPDINAVRNRDGRFTMAYTISGPSNYDTVKYVFTDGVQSGLFFRTVNQFSGFERPKAGFRLVNGDSCFAVWSQRNGGSGNNIWAVGGCTGQITIGIENTGNEIPASYSLNQNYPNPFNPTTNIKFNIPKSGHVKLVIYDITGKEVETLIDENLSAGTYKSDFDASRLASGVYLYRITSSDFTDVKKMVLIK